MRVIPKRIVFMDEQTLCFIRLLDIAVWQRSGASCRGGLSIIKAFFPQGIATPRVGLFAFIVALLLRSRIIYSSSVFFSFDTEDDSLCQSRQPNLLEPERTG